MKKSTLENIPELKSRLTVLKSKYDELTKDLERELNENLLSDDMHNYFMLLYDREIIQRQIERVESYIAADEKVQIKTSLKVEVGSLVHLKNHTHELDLRIVNPNEARPNEGIISSISPIGSAILGKRKGDNVEVDLPKGKIHYKIMKVN